MLQDHENSIHKDIMLAILNSISVKKSKELFYRDQESVLHKVRSPGHEPQADGHHCDLGADGRDQGVISLGKMLIIYASRYSSTKLCMMTSGNH